MIPRREFIALLGGGVQLHALAYNLDNFLRTLATPEPIKDGSLTSLKDKLIKIGAKVVSHGRYVVFQKAEVAIARQMFQGDFAAHRGTAAAAATSAGVRRSRLCIQEQPTEGVRCAGSRRQLASGFQGS